MNCFIDVGTCNRYFVRNIKPFDFNLNPSEGFLFTGRPARKVVGFPTKQREHSCDPSAFAGCNFPGEINCARQVGVPSRTQSRLPTNREMEQRWPIVSLSCATFSVAENVSYLYLSQPYGSITKLISTYRLIFNLNLNYFLKSSRVILEFYYFSFGSLVPS